MKNPILRLLEVAGTEQKTFYEGAGFSKVTMVYIGTGQYEQLSDRMLDAVFDLCESKGLDWNRLLEDEYGTEYLDEAYRSWRREERLAKSSTFNVKPREVWTKEQSPFMTYVLDTAGTVQSFSKGLKVDQAKVRLYAKGEAKSMPSSLESAFRDIKFPYLGELVGMQYNWKSEFC